MYVGMYVLQMYVGMYVLHMYVGTYLLHMCMYRSTSQVHPPYTYDLPIPFRFVWSIAAVGSQTIHDKILVESIAMATLSEVQPPTNCTNVFQTVMEK